MKKRFLCWGISVAMVFSFIALPTRSFAEEIKKQNVSCDEGDQLVSDGETRIYAADIEYGIDTVTLGVAVSSMDRGASEIDLILQDSGYMLSGDAGESPAEDIKEGRYPLIRIVNDEVFVNGNHLAYCVQILTGEDELLEWMEDISPETGWICIDEDFLSMVSDVFDRMPDSWDVESAIEKWADSVYAVETDGGDDVIYFNETTLLALTMTLDQLGRGYQEPVKTFLEDELKERFGDEITNAMMDSGRFSDRELAEERMEYYFRSLRSTIGFSLFQNSYTGFRSILYALYDANLTGWLLQGIDRDALEGILEIGDGHGKLTLTADDDTVTLETGGSDALLWGRVVDSYGEVQGSLVINNGEKEKAVLCKIGEDYINVRMTLQEPDTISVSLQDGINRTQISGLITVEEDDSILFTPNAGMYGLLKSIRLYSAREDPKDSHVLEIPQAIDLDTLIYRIACETMGSQDDYEDETE